MYWFLLGLVKVFRSIINVRSITIKVYLENESAIFYASYISKLKD